MMSACHYSRLFSQVLEKSSIFQFWNTQLFFQAFSAKGLASSLANLSQWKSLTLQRQWVKIDISKISPQPLDNKWICPLRSRVKPFGEVWFNRNSTTNILSWKDMANKYRITTDSEITRAVFKFHPSFILRVLSQTGGL